MISDKQIAMEWLKYAVNNQDTETPIREYIRFMDSLPEYKRKLLLSEPDIIKLIDIINMGVK